MTLFRLAISSFLLACLAVSLCSGQQVYPEQDDYEFAFADAPPDLLALRKRIIDESHRTDSNEWMGRYFADIGEDSYLCLLWSPSVGYILFRYSDTPWPLDLSTGKADFDGTELRLTPAGAFPSVWSPAYRTTFEPIRWGNTHFLISSDDLVDFACAVNSQSPTEVGRFLRKAQGLPTPDKLPALPSNCLPYLSRDPIDVRITKIYSRRITDGPHDRPYDETTFILSAGSDNGVAVGMAFWQSNPNKVYDKLRVTSVTRKTAVARFAYRSLEEWGYLQVPRVGARHRNREPRGFKPYG